MDETVFTTSALIEILSQIEELQDYEISVTEQNGAVQISIGDSVYKINQPTETVAIPEEALAEVSEINDAVYDDFGGEPVEEVTSGIIRETLKTLLVGGAVRLVTNILKGR